MAVTLGAALGVTFGTLLWRAIVRNGDWDFSQGAILGAWVVFFAGYLT